MKINEQSKRPENFVKFGRVCLIFWDARGDTQTDRHTGTLIAILRTIPGAK